MSKKILRLTLKKKWFDLIASGEKKVVYLGVKHWSTSRLVNADGTRIYDEVWFTNGFGSDKPFMRVEWFGLGDSWTCPPKNEEPLIATEMYYAIELGKVLEVKNDKPPPVKTYFCRLESGDVFTIDGIEGQQYTKRNQQLAEQTDGNLIIIDNKVRVKKVER